MIGPRQGSSETRRCFDAAAATGAAAVAAAQPYLLARSLSLSLSLSEERGKRAITTRQTGARVLRRPSCPVVIQTILIK